MTLRGSGSARLQPSPGSARLQPSPGRARLQPSRIGKRLAGRLALPRSGYTIEPQSDELAGDECQERIRREEQAIYVGRKGPPADCELEPADRELEETDQRQVRQIGRAYSRPHKLASTVISANVAAPVHDPTPSNARWPLAKIIAAVVTATDRAATEGDRLRGRSASAAPNARPRMQSPAWPPAEPDRPR